MPPRRITPIAVNSAAANSNSNSLGPNNRNNATKKYQENMFAALADGKITLEEALRLKNEKQRERNNAIYEKYKKRDKAKKKEKVMEWNNLNEPNNEMKNEARKLGVKLTTSYKINGKTVREEIPRGKLRKKINKAKKILKEKAEAKAEAVKAKANAKEKEAKAKANAKAAKVKAKANAEAAKAKMPNLKKRAKALKVSITKPWRLPMGLPQKKYVYKSVNELENNIANAEKAMVREERRKRYEQRKKNERAAEKTRAKAKRDYEKLNSTKKWRNATRGFFLKNKSKSVERSKKVRKAARNNLAAKRRGAAPKKKGIPQALKNEAKRLGIKLTYTRPGSSSGTYLSVKQIQAKINAKKGGAGAKNNAARRIQSYRNQRDELLREYKQILNEEERRLRKQLANINSNSNSNALVPHFIRRQAAANANARVAQILNNNTATNYSSSNSNNNYRVNRSPAVKPSMVKKSSGGRFTSARMQQLARNAARRPRWV